MIRASGAVIVALVTLVICCNADHQQEQELSDHNSAERYESDLKQRQELENFLRFLLQHEIKNDGRYHDYVTSNLLAKALTGNGRSNDGGSSLLGRSLTYGNNLGDSSLLGRGIGRNNQYARFVDALGGGNFVRNLDSIGGANLVRNLDSIGGANLVKKNLDQIGGPNLVKRNLDALGGGNFVRNLDSIGGANLVREVDPLVREAHRMAHLGRRYDYLSPYGSRALLSPLEYGYYGEGFPKRNFDEIDRSNLNTFVKKRNFDEIDLSSMPFPFKRFYHLMGPNYLDNPVSNLDKKRYRPDYPMDEIDLSPFPIGSKRSSESHSLR
ncbi:orcokinin peptides-like isoform X2 [Zerene cesonia]|uniref:orcokinin peptides-like isoform X2 n=1 Tax=Zerene cesonia TaxID=33412 RepID=UPI0018E55A75|nr:orcokinin peptides-like isoform X2 [Zerene cesonia]